jgi:hypothetical protein
VPIATRSIALQADVYRRFGFAFDHFGRTSAPQNHALTQHFYRRLDAAGLIEERSVRQVWSAQDRRFLPDRYVRWHLSALPFGSRARRPVRRLRRAARSDRPDRPSALGTLRCD